MGARPQWWCASFSFIYATNIFECLLCAKCVTRHLENDDGKKSDSVPVHGSVVCWHVCESWAWYIELFLTSLLEYQVLRRVRTMLRTSHCCFPIWLSGCLAGFVNSQKGGTMEFDINCPNYLGSLAMMGSLLGARGMWGSCLICFNLWSSVVLIAVYGFHFPFSASNTPWVFLLPNRVLSSCVCQSVGVRLFVDLAGRSQARPLLLIQYQVFFSEGNVNVEGGGFGRTSEVLWEKAEREVPHNQGELLRWLDLLGHLFEQQLATLAAIVHIQGQLCHSSLNFELPSPAGSFLSQFPLAKMRL